MKAIPPCPDNWETCLTCGARPDEPCRDPDLQQEGRDPLSYKGYYASGQPVDVRKYADEESVAKELIRAVLSSEPPAFRPTMKASDPKESVGIRKVPMSVVPAPVLAEAAVGLLEGARKYGRHNWRVTGARASVYYDAALRHLMQWWEGEDIDPDSGLSHVTKAICSLIVLRDAMMTGNFTDDRPPVAPEGFVRDLEPAINDLFDRYPTAAKAHCQISDQ